ncbi:3-phosphoserine/phosphohydroxythreonine transaminase [Luteitalea sp. TBR-22]|uniref:3-phosphoserine/phosphohydroxythreonine transaminase n=1 Tax=Luteitalea sp. TBR-22 TaxID=2802971 RepID=UPI001EF4D0E9|nr:3-phosphoserine/phosphohydroxythreonine transaminase [Luteitalea sp. TBR-22]
MTLTATHRVFNFSSGPAVLPEPVLLEAQRDLFEFPGAGMSVMEMSHRSRPFDRILEEAESTLREVAAIPDSHAVLFLQGGASLQFSMLPMNLLPPGGSADYVITGVWGQKAIAEARKLGAVRVAASTEAGGFRRVPRQDELDLDPSAAFVHLTTNNTIYGSQWPAMPDVGDVPLVVDASSDIFSRPIDVARYGVVYAGAQKNLGPSGVTLVVIRKDLLARSSSSLPTMLNYAVHAEHGSRYNTPNTFGIYILGLVARWMRAEGGLEALGARNARKAAAVYAEIDRTGFYRGHADADSRSLMNITFRLRDESLEDAFAQAATREGLDGLKGHRSVGGLRASMYNAFPESGVEALVQFMREFERIHG